MHTSGQLRSDSFAIELEGRPASIEDVLVGFAPLRRVGAVVREPYGAVGASNLLLAAVTAFYDAQRARAEDFYIYPDYFLFHVGRPLGDHSMLDVWPSHKEVVVPDDAEAILEAINDRAITWLLVPDGEPALRDVHREARASADSRIRGGSPTRPPAASRVRTCASRATRSPSHTCGACLTPTGSSRPSATSRTPMPPPSPAARAKCRLNSARRFGRGAIGCGRAGVRWSPTAGYGPIRRWDCFDWVDRSICG